MASRASSLICSTREIPADVAGSPSRAMMKRAALPSGDRNIFRPRWKSGFLNADCGR
ncbi:hypothetical protein LAUMK136_00676 [Mycobacterium attenuatum]|uniref:Uncharacterized protein n=1 Tax=Mycobacterium attenuatum TaxID=2341086 RepID=A0A498PRV5_9MYCO|nr:hypothetical protein LAUMK136_00676 [Mycobacterium attenuatum]